MVLTIAIVSFLLGSVITGLVVHLRHSNKSLADKEELIRLRAKLETSESLQEIIRRDFVQLANETIKNEQEDLRKQNRETLEEKGAQGVAQKEAGGADEEDGSRRHVQRRPA